MQNIPTPHERLEAFRDKIGLNERDLAALDPYREIFAARKDDFSAYFYETLHEFPDTRRFLELERRRGRLRTNWKNFFGFLFTSRFDRNFLTFLWKSGLTHVEMSVDQRYINLGYVLAKRFCSQIIAESVPERDRLAVTEAIGKMLDMCLLIATDAFLAATTQCDSEVMNGIAHQVRNPIAVIGGFLGTLRRKAGPESPLGDIYAAMFNETKRLERMVSDVGTFIDIFRQPPEVANVNLEEVVREAWDALKPPADAKLELRLDPAHAKASCDRRQIRVLFLYLLENSLEALDPANPAVSVGSSVREESPTFLTVEIFNSGEPPREEDMEKLFTPFYSSKPLGTGFGLPIARLVAKKVQGNVTLEPVPGEGTRVLVKIPVAA